MPPRGLINGDGLHLLTLFLLLGLNLGVKLYFKNERDRKKMQQLKSQTLEQQLEHLRYQLNPHFFMNTLNNIHALMKAPRPPYPSNATSPSWKTISA